MAVTDSAGHSVPSKLPSEVSTAVWNGIGVPVITDTYATARLLAGLREGQIVLVKGRASDNDGGQGVFYVRPAGSLVDDDGVTLISGSFAIVRLIENDVHAEWWGAVGDSSGVPGNGTDNTNAIRRALAFCTGGYSYSGSFGLVPAVIETKGHSLCFGTGCFRVTGNLSDLTSVGVAAGRKQGFAIKGVSPYKTFIFADRGSGEYLFDDGAEGSAIRSYIGLAFQDLAVIGSATLASASSFMRINSGTNQSLADSSRFHTFRNVLMARLKRVLTANGSLNTDLTTWDSCRFWRIWEHVLDLNNVNSVSHGFSNCEVVETYCDSVFRFNGGGSISWVGGSIINGFPAASGGKDSPQWVVEQIKGSQGDKRNVFQNTRIELRGQYSRLVKASGSLQSATVFENVGFAGQSDVGVSRDIIDLAGRHRVEMHKCSMSAGNVADADLGIKLTSVVDDERQPARPKVLLVDSETPVFDSSNVTFAGTDTKGGTVQSIRGYSLYQNDTTSAGPNVARSFTFPSATAGLGREDVETVIHRAAIFRAGEYWPNSVVFGFTENSLLLPENAVILKIIVFKPAGQAAQSATYQLHIGNGDKSVTYGSSVSGRMDAEHKIVVDDMLINVGNNATSRTVRLWADPAGGATNHYDGFAVVEYL